MAALRRFSRFLFALFLLSNVSLMASQIFIPLTLPNGKVLRVELAVTDQERALGLMYRRSLPDDYGMLFVFDRVDYHSFWMKNTYLPLDLVWIGPDRRIVEIQQGVPPCKTSQCPSYFPKVPALFVLELPSGKASFYRLKAGDPLGFLLP